MGAPALKNDYNIKSTYSDYLQWETEDRYELLEGLPILMSPASNADHQNLAGAIYSEIRAILKKKESGCRVFIAPFDVVLPEINQNAEDSVNVVQPDVLVVCDSSKITSKNCTGAPDLVVEILSPSTAVNDQKFKYNLYEKHGVKEYWIVSPIDRYMICYHLNESGKYERKAVFTKNDKISLFFAEDELLNLSDVFE
jgi:Uma2 family endonuclease